MTAHTHVLGVAALSPDSVDPRLALGWDASPAAPTAFGFAPATAPMSAPGWGRPQPIMASPETSLAVAAPPASATTYFIWDHEDILVETDGDDSVWLN